MEVLDVFKCWRKDTKVYRKWEKMCRERCWLTLTEGRFYLLCGRNEKVSCMLSDKLVHFMSRSQKYFGLMASLSCGIERKIITWAERESRPVRSSSWVMKKWAVGKNRKLSRSLPCWERKSAGQCWQHGCSLHWGDIFKMHRPLFYPHTYLQ